MILAQNPTARKTPNVDEPVTTFQSKVNLVLVPVVVRDSKGRAIGNLTREEFQLFDKGKPQRIVSFSAVQRPASHEESAGSTALADSSKKSGTDEGHANSSHPDPASGATDRYFIYLFDDMNIRFSDMAQVRQAAIRHFHRGLTTGDRAAIDTFSGRPVLEFTNDRQKLEDTANKVHWRPSAGQDDSCPHVSYYLADLIMTKGESQARMALVAHTAECAKVRLEFAEVIAMAAVNRELVIGLQTVEIALRTLRLAIRRLSGMPGQRVIVLASPGFFAQTPEAIKAMTEVLDLAAKSNVTISSLSARGVILAEEEEDVTGRIAPPVRQNSPAYQWLRYRRETARANGDVLNDLAEGTGGTFFRNNNDLRLGFEKASTPPEYSYVLGFSPATLKPDGSFHQLKVRLMGEKRVSVEARRGYYALKDDVKDRTATADIDDAVFGRDQMSDIPVVLQTGYSKPNTGDRAKVLAVAKVDVKSLHFKKGDGLNHDSLKVVFALFDAEGGYVAGTTKSVNLNLREETLGQAEPGFTVRWEDDVTPGRYLVRLVVREAGGKAMTLMNRTVTIP